MNFKELALVLALVATSAPGCFTHDISRNPKDRTDFRVGQVYKLRQDVQMHHNRSLLPIYNPKASAAIVPAGLCLEVVKITFSSSPTVGRLTSVYAKPISGPLKEKRFSVDNISQKSWKDGTTFVDESYLVLTDRDCD